jgi:hypothetical protein
LTTLALFPTAEDSGPVQLQMVPTTNGFLELVELGVLDAGVLVAFEVALDELLEPQALRPIAPATSAQHISASPRAR